MMNTTRLRVDDVRLLPWLSRMGLVAVLLGVASACWVLTAARMSGMDGMGTGSGTDLGGVGSFGLTWAVMMAAMMLPSLVPMAIAHARIHGRQSGTLVLPVGATLVFVAGYLASWSALGVAGYLVAGAVRSQDVGFLAWNEAGRYVAGGVIIGAALYQLTGLKGVCLRPCRTPQTLARHWRPGRLGTLRMGLEHGGFCIGSSWALMAVLAVLGLMSLGWMAFVAALVALEKLLPRTAPQVLATHGIAVSLAVLGTMVAFAPAYVPGLAMHG